MRGERGQTTVEWTALVLLAAVALGALATVGPRVDGRSLGAGLAHSIACAVRDGCGADRRQLARAHGDSDAELLERFAPGLVYEPGTYALPVDPRECRSHECADAPDDRDLDVHRSRRGGVPATAFTHVVRRDGRTYLQYWLYYPDSTSTVGNVAGAWNTASRAVTALGSGDAKDSYPGYHPDDWESVQVRIDDGSGDAYVRASSHHGYQGCKSSACKNEWTPLTGWARVSRGSHAGHIPLEQRGGDVTFSVRDGFGTTPRTYSPRYPGVDLRERTTSAAGIRLLPVEALPPDMRFAVSAPWRKKVYRDPASNSTG